MDSRPGDEMLLLGVAERDTGVFRTLYERHAGRRAVRLARRCNDRGLVADAIGVVGQLSTPVPALRQVS
jgi:RNA polymerase sigma-70 factor (ECF subfamily)